MTIESQQEILLLWRQIRLLLAAALLVAKQWGISVTAAVILCSTISILVVDVVGGGSTRLN